MKATSHSGMMGGAPAPTGCSSFKLRQLSRRVSQHFDAVVAHAGLKTTQYSLLSQIVRLGPVRPGLLADAMEMDASTLTRNLQPLVAQGWVEIGPGEDARSRLVSATAAGRDKRAQAQREWKRAQLAFNERVGRERVARLHAIIDECLALMSDEPGQAPPEDPAPQSRPDVRAARGPALNCPQGQGAGRRRARRSSEAAAAPLRR